MQSADKQAASTGGRHGRRGGGRPLLTNARKKSIMKIRGTEAQALEVNLTPKGDDAVLFKPLVHFVPLLESSHRVGLHGCGA